MLFSITSPPQRIKFLATPQTNPQRPLKAAISARTNHGTSGSNVLKNSAHKSLENRVPCYRSARARLLVKNIGEQQGSCMLSVLIENGQIFSWVSWTDLDGGTNKTVWFGFTPEAEGNYNVDFNNLTGSFTVKAPPKPAEYEFSNLMITPEEVEEGLPVNISVDVSNVGELEGTYRLELMVEGEKVDAQDVTLEGGESVTIFFDLTRNEGDYRVEIDGKKGRFTVNPKPSFWDNIPGFPYESIILGLIAVIIILWRSRKF